MSSTPKSCWVVKTRNNCCINQRVYGGTTMRTYKRQSLLIATFGLLLAFQNCSPVQMSATDALGKGGALNIDAVPELPDEEVIVDDGGDAVIDDSTDVV